MATENQKQLISDFEAAIAAVRMKNPERLTINEVCELAGRNAIELRAVVLRIATKPEDGHLLRRLMHAFKTVGLCPQYLAQAVAELDQPKKPVTIENDSVPEAEEKSGPEPLKFSPQPKPDFQAPKLVTQSQAVQVPIPVVEPKNEEKPVSERTGADYMHEIVKILEKLPERQQRRIIVAASAYYGIGE